MRGLTLARVVVGNTSPGEASREQAISATGDHQREKNKLIAGRHEPTSKNAWHGLKDLFNMAKSEGINSFLLNDVNRRVTGAGWTHASDGVRMKDLLLDELPVGAIVGTVEILNQWSYFNPSLQSPLPWAAPGQYQWKMRDLRVLPRPIPLKGKQGILKIPSDVEEQIVASIGG